MYKRDIHLDIDDNLNNYIKSVELDSNSRVWHFHLTVDYEPLDLTGKSVQFRAEKPDKTNVLNDCKIVDAEKGVVEVKLTRQVNAIPGHVKCLLKIIGAEGFVLKTKTFVVDVSKTLSDDAIVSSDEFGALEAALGKVKDIDNRFAQTNAQLSAIKEHCTGGNGMQEHSHFNKMVIDKFTEDDNGLPLYDGNSIGIEIDDARYSDVKTLSSNKIKEFLDYKADANVVDSFTIYYDDTAGYSEVESKAVTYSHKKRFIWTNSEYNTLVHNTAIVDTSQYVGQNINVRIELKCIGVSNVSTGIAINMYNCTALEKGGVLGAKGVFVSSSPLVDNVFEFVSQNVSIPINSEYPYLKICQAVSCTELPATCDWHINVYINDVKVKNVSFGGAFSDDEVTVTNASGGSIGSGGSEIIPPSGEQLEGIYVDGNKVVTDGVTLPNLTENLYQNIYSLSDIINAVTLRYETDTAVANLESRAVSYTYKRQVEATVGYRNDLFHMCAVVDLNKYLGQTVDVRIESHAINVSNVADGNGSEKLNMFGSGTPTTGDASFVPSTQVNFADVNFSGGEMIVDNTQSYTVNSSYRYAKICHAVKTTGFPATIKWHLNVYVNGTKVSVLDFGSVFPEEQLKFTVISGNTTGGGTGGGIMPPIGEVVDGLYLNGDLTLVNGMTLPEWIDYLQNLSGTGSGGGSGSGTVSSSYWQGKIWNALGDSITEVNHHTTKQYHQFAKEILGIATVRNYGISGTTIAKKNTNDNSAMCIRCQSMDTNADLITVAGGVNDLGFNIPLGSLDTLDDPTTFYGGCKLLMESLIQRYPDKVIAIITPAKQDRFFRSPNNVGATTEDYTRILKEMASKYALPVFDNNALSGIYPKISANSSAWTTDGLHWNIKGHERVGRKLAQFLNTL